MIDFNLVKKYKNKYIHGLMKELSQIPFSQRLKQLEKTNEKGSTFLFFLGIGNYFDEALQCIEWGANINHINENGSFLYHVLVDENTDPKDIERRNQFCEKILSHPEFILNYFVFNECFPLIFWPEKEKYPVSDDIKKIFLQKIEDNWDNFSMHEKTNIQLQYSNHNLSRSFKINRDVQICLNYLLTHLDDLGNLKTFHGEEIENHIVEGKNKELNEIISDFVQNSEKNLSEFKKFSLQLKKYLDGLYNDNLNENISITSSDLRKIKKFQSFCFLANSPFRKLQSLPEVYDFIFQKLGDYHEPPLLKEVTIRNEKLNNLVKKYELASLTVRHDFFNEYGEYADAIIEDLLKKGKKYFGSHVYKNQHVEFRNHIRGHDWKGVHEEILNPWSQKNLSIVCIASIEEQVFIHEMTHSIQFNGLSCQDYLKNSQPWVEIKNIIKNRKLSHEEIVVELSQTLKNISNDDTIEILPTNKSPFVEFKKMLGSLSISQDQKKQALDYNAMLSYIYKYQKKDGFKNRMWAFMDKVTHHKCYYKDDMEIHARLNEDMYLHMNYNESNDSKKSRSELMEINFLNEIKPHLMELNHQLIDLVKEKKTYQVVKK